MNDPTKKRLLDALLACRAIRSFTDGFDLAAYEQDLLVRSGVERQLAIVGEALGAAARAEPSLRDQLPDLGQSIGLRNRIIHGYDTVDDRIVWDVVQRKLPAPEAVIAALLPENSDTP